MSRPGLKPPCGHHSLVSTESSREFSDQRTCVSAPTQLVFDRGGDCDWKAGHAAATHGALKSSDVLSSSFRHIKCACADREADVYNETDHAGSDKPLEQAVGDFTDFMDSTSVASDDVAELTDDDFIDGEPCEYWEKAWSYSRSPFSNCSAFSFESSQDEAENDNEICRDLMPETDSTLPSLSTATPALRPRTSILRHSESSLSLMRRWSLALRGEGRTCKSTSV